MESEDFNPYAAPLSYESGDALTEYYRIDYRRLTYREHWRIAMGVLPFLILATMKTLRLPARRLVPNAFPRIKSLDIVPRGELPPEVWEAWSVFLSDCAENQITVNFLTRTPVFGPGLTAYSASMLSEDEMIAATLTYERVQRPRVDRLVVGYSVTSMLPDGRYAVTTGTGVAFDSPKEIVVKRLPGATIPQLLKAHRDWVSTFNPPIVPMDRAGQRARVLAATQLQFDYYINRGVYVPMTEKEFEAIARLSEMPLKDAPPPETRYARFLNNMGFVGFLLWIVSVILLYTRPGNLWIFVFLVAAVGLSIVSALLKRLRRRRIRNAGRGRTS